MSKLRVIGDVHGHFDSYLKIVTDQSVNYSLQIGDLGFEYSPLDVLDPEKHRFIVGNHDNHDNLPPHALDRFGVWDVPSIDAFIFYVSGAYSIDKFNRTPWVDWWPNEELDFSEQHRALHWYQQIKPKTMITHDAPTEVKKYVSNPDVLEYYKHNRDFVSNTQELLQSMLDIHRPDIWVFGHYHMDWHKEIKGCKFICLNELQYIDCEE